MKINTQLANPGQERQSSADKKGSGRHVLVMALSTFPKAKSVTDENGKREVTSMDETAYYYEEYNPKTGDETGETKPQRLFRHISNGYYQLEPISWFIKKELGEKVTDVVLLETWETINDKRTNVSPSPYFRRLDPEEAAAETEQLQTDGSEPEQKGSVQTAGTAEGQSESIPAVETTLGEVFEQTAPSFNGERTGWSAAEYFTVWLKEFWGQDLTVHHVEIDETDPAAALVLVTKKIRELYEEIEDKDNWRLWMDTHGGFRDISMVLISAARFFATDGLEPIDTNGIFSVYHSQKSKDKKKDGDGTGSEGKEQEKTEDGNKAGEDENNKDNDLPAGDRIINQTAFYFTESAEALKKFLDYGQYLAHKFQPYKGEEKHAFVSYRHDIKLLTSIRCIFTQFKQNGILYWYDDGIRYRANWKKELEKQNMESEVFIALLSNSYFVSVECWKELIRAVSGKKKNYEKIHFLLLEKNVKLPKSPMDCVLSDEEKEEIRRLQAELGVTDEDLRECFGIGTENRYVQWFKWFEYMDSNAAVNQRTPEDIDGQIREAFARIRTAING